MFLSSFPSKKMIKIYTEQVIYVHEVRMIIYNNPEQSQQKKTKPISGLLDKYIQFVHRFHQFIESHPRKRNLIPILDKILYMAGYYYGSYLCPSRETIVKEIGCDIATASDITTLLHEAGLVKKTHRLYTSNMYEPHEYFFIPSVRMRLQYILRSLKTDLLEKLFVVTRGHQMPFVVKCHTNSYSEEYNYKKRAQPASKKCRSRILTSNLFEKRSPEQPPTGDSLLKKENLYEDDYCQGGRYGTIG